MLGFSSSSGSATAASKFARVQCIYNAVFTVLFILLVLCTVILISIVKVDRDNEIALHKNSSVSLPVLPLEIETTDIPEQNETDDALEKVRYFDISLKHIRLLVNGMIINDRL